MCSSDLFSVEYSNKGSYTLRTDIDAGAGYQVEGWYNNKELTGGALGTEINVTGDMTVYARKSKTGDGWKNVIYKNGIVVDADGNTVTEGVPENLTSGTEVSGLSAKQYNEGTAYTLVKRPSYMAGYTFEGWYSDAECTAAIDSISAETTGDVTVYAKWKVYSGWDGKSEKEPAKADDGVYEIYYVDELNWFAKQVNSGNNAIRSEERR